MPMTQRGLNRMVNAWMRRLGIIGWKIRARFVSMDEMVATYNAKRLYYGSCMRFPQKQRAEIKIVNPFEIPDGPGSIESTIIHELLHIRLDPMGTLDDDSAFETGLDAVAEALTKR